MKLVVDAMGGDHGPAVTVLGAIEAVKEHPIDIILTGDKDQIEKELKKYQYPKNQIEILHCSEEITNEDKPVASIRKKKDSSMVVGLNLVKEKKADAIISAGNTGGIISRWIIYIGQNQRY